MQKNSKQYIGVICRPRKNPTEKYIFTALEKKFNIIFFPVQKDIDYESLKEKSNKIKIVLNTAGDVPNVEDALEIVKTFEGLGKQVIDSSHSFYYKEDKWLFYQVCLKHGLPTPKTYFIPRDIYLSKDKLKQILGDGPVVFKGIFSDTGRAVKRALDYDDALNVVKSLRNKVGNMPLIAQQYIAHGTVSYRVTLINKKIIQAVIKYGKNWKEGKLFWKNERYHIFKVDKNLARLCERAANAFGIEWCGIDFIRDEQGKWYIIEVNSCPSMDFIIRDARRASRELINYLFSLHKIMQHKSKKLFKQAGQHIKN